MKTSSAQHPRVGSEDTIGSLRHGEDRVTGKCGHENSVAKNLRQQLPMYGLSYLGTYPSEPNAASYLRRLKVGNAPEPT